MSSLALNLKEQLKAGRDEVIATFQNDHKPEKLLTSLRVSVDAALTQAWQALAFPENMTLIAVGGYGRGELFPYSDVDVLILLDAAPDDALRAKLEEIVQLFWDLGLEIGHSIRTIDECLSESAADITVQTSLLEARLITGNRTLFKKLQERFDEAMDARAFFQAKTLELQQRHAKYETTPNSLEPNCKESPGGLRDLQVILRTANAAGLGKSWDELARSGIATPFEARQIKRNEALLGLIRARLHVIAQRREDRLVFDLQTAVAESFGYENQIADNGKIVARASEMLRK